jgi:ATP-dependent DNA helicase RecG
VLRSLVDDGWLRYPTRPGEPYRRGTRLQHEEVREAAPGVFVSPPRARQSGTLDDRIVEAVRDAGELSARDIAEAIGSSLGSVRQRLRVLVEQRAIVPTANAQSNQRTYRIG